jgi:flagellar biosynthesis protein FlhA
VSEVAARFTLDSMPGQQMSIDADLNMGLVDQAEAQRRRHELEQEAAFYGAMDGASKFVKGDAIAAIIILLINIIAGSLIGILQLGLSWGEALQHFTLLTIGDGIAAQLPALIVSVATGIIVTRSSADQDLSTEIYTQLSSIPRIPRIVGVALLCLLLLPGMPKWPIVIVAAWIGIAWWRSRHATPAGEAGLTSEVTEDAPVEVRSGGIDILLGEELAAALRDQRGSLLDRIAAIRRAHVAEFGVPLPPVRIVDGEGLAFNDVDVQLLGTRFGRMTIHPDRRLAISTRDANARLEGIEANEPSLGRPGFWILPEQVEEARDRGFAVAEPGAVMMAYVADIVRAEAARLLTRPVFLDMLDTLRQRQPSLVEELIPTMLSVAETQSVLRLLLAEGVSLANLDLVMETLVDLARTQREPELLAEMLRQRIGFAICNQLRGRHDDLAVLSLDPRLENDLTGHLAGGGRPLDPRLADSLVRRIAPLADRMFRDGRAPVLLCGTEIRKALRTLTQRAIPRLAVVSVGKIPERIDIRSYDVVTIDG